MVSIFNFSDETGKAQKLHKCKRVAFAMHAVITSCILFIFKIYAQSFIILSFPKQINKLT